MAVAYVREAQLAEASLDKAARRLRFPREFEQVFLIKYYRESIGHIRLALGLGLLAYAAFGVVDLQLAEAPLGLALFIRYAVVCPIIMLLLALSFHSLFQRYYALLFSLGILLVGCGVVATNALHPPPEAWYQQTSLVLVLLFGYTFTRIRFRYATLVGWGTTVAALYSSWFITDAPARMFTYIAMVLITANFFGMFAAYLIEYFQRRHFLEERRRDIERLRFKRLSDELRSSTNNDALTGIPNRYAFEQALATEYRKAASQNGTITVAVIGIDYFQQYNQAVGHREGDDCLRAVANALDAMPRRPGDMAARHAGAEFVCVLPDTDAKTTDELLSPVLRAVDELGLANPAPSAPAFVTATAAAVIVQPQPGGEALDALDAARKRLLKARNKATGEVHVTDVDLGD